MYAEYIGEKDTQETQEVRDKLWAWLIDPNHEVKGLIAINDKGVVVGFVHYRPFPVLSGAEKGGFIDDLFVTPNARGKRIAKELIEAVVKIGKKNNWKGIRWMTDESNVSAKKAYDKLAIRTNWVTYDIAPL